jgi:predicted nucleic acid-binding Zn ribbon protein
MLQVCGMVAEGRERCSLAAPHSIELRRRRRASSVPAPL